MEKEPLYEMSVYFDHLMHLSAHEHSASFILSAKASVFLSQFHADNKTARPW